MDSVGSIRCLKNLELRAKVVFKTEEKEDIISEIDVNGGKDD